MRLDGAFCGVNIAINYLEVRQAPIAEQIRPRRFRCSLQHPKQRNAVVNFGALPQPSATLAAAPPLQPPEEPGVAIRHVPKLPRDHTGAMPVRVHVSAAVPEIDMPTEAIDRLAAHAAESRTLVYARSRYGAGGALYVAGNPSLPLSSSCQVQPLGAPLRAASARASRSARIGWARQSIYRKPRGRRHERAASAQDRTADGKMPGNALLRRASDRRFLSAFSACHLDIFRPPRVRRS